MQPADGPALHVCAARVRLLLPGAQTLKDRRAVVRSLTGRLAQRFNLSVADLDGGAAAVNGAVLALATVSASPAYGRQHVDEAVRFIDGFDGVEVLDVEFLEI